MYSDFSKKLLLGLVVVLSLSFLLAKKFARGKDSHGAQTQQVLATEKIAVVAHGDRHEASSSEMGLVESLKALPFFTKKRVIKASEYSIGKSDQSGVLVLKVGDETVQTLKSQLTPAACPKSLPNQSRCIALMNENILEVSKDLRDHLPDWLSYEAQYLGNAQLPPRP